MGKAEIWNFSTSFKLDIAQVGAVIFHILQAIQRRNILKMLFRVKKLKMTRSETKRNSDHA